MTTHITGQLSNKTPLASICAELLIRNHFLKFSTIKLKIFLKRGKKKAKGRSLRTIRCVHRNLEGDLQSDTKTCAFYPAETEHLIPALLVQNETGSI